MKIGRRSFLTSIAAGGSIAGCLTNNTKHKQSVLYLTESGVQSKQVNQYLPQETDKQAGIITGSGGPNYPDIDSYKSEIYWVEQDTYPEFSDSWLGAAKVYPTKIFDGKDAISYIFLNESAQFISDFVLYHERGHNLGFKHIDGGIMDYTVPDREIQSTHKTTKEIAEHTDSLSYIQWDERSFRKFYTKWKNNEIWDAAMLYALDQYMNNSTTDIYSNGAVAESLLNIPNDINLFGGGFYRPENSGWKVE